MRSKHDIKNLTASFYSVPLKTPKTKLEVIPPKDVEGDRDISSEDHSVTTKSMQRKFLQDIYLEYFVIFRASWI